MHFVKQIDYSIKIYLGTVLRAFIRASFKSKLFCSFSYLMRMDYDGHVMCLIFAWVAKSRWLLISISVCTKRFSVFFCVHYAKIEWYLQNNRWKHKKPNNPHRFWKMNKMKSNWIKMATVASGFTKSAQIYNTS